MQRYHVFLMGGKDLYVEGGEIKLTGETIYVKDDEGRVVAEFYKEAVAGWELAKAAYGV